MTEFINRIALARNHDSAHRIHFVREGRLESMPLAELDRQASCVAAHLRGLGIGRGDRVGVMARNCIEWILVDLAVLKLGGVIAGFDANRFDAATALQRYGLRHIFVDDASSGGERIVSIAAVREWTGGPELAIPFHDGYRPEDICTIKFTSGSTGQPKGLETTTGSIDDSMTSVQEMFAHGPGDNLLVFFRLALLQQRYWIYSALTNGHDVTIASHDDALSVAQFVHPTVIMAAPGFYDEVKRRLESAADELHRPDVRYDAIQSIFGGAVRYLWTGSAPADRATLDFYNDCGVPLYQGYGLNETCIVSKNCPGAHRIGSVGKVLPNKSVRFDSDGMVIVGGRHLVNTHYSWCSPGDNERMFLPSGEVRTHDLGYLDADGFLYIRGRVDDIVVLSSGRNVLVPPLEERVRAHPAVHECVLYGTARPFLTALISPADGTAEAASIQDFIDEMNTTLLAEQRIHAVVVADERFSIDNGLLTSQFKPVRKEIARRLAPRIEEIYATVELDSCPNFVIEA
ncbi:MAG TPA: AMP-binding protein [Thermoanaerobaculia bacterium]|jgi:long-subunit acyl-CoA synthetase (AMP-forming)|nr:AMP-binding protein [Thermoanaerobaculia bacterium]